MARKLIVELVADPTSLEKGYATAARSTRAFSKEIEHASRGALSGTGIFSSFGKSLAFASGGFVAFQGVSEFLTASINAARDAGVAQRSLAAQMKASGESFRQNREEIDKAALSYERFGFQNDDVVKSLTILERGTGRINQALRLQGLTADIARAKNIDLSSAANVVAKVFGHQETALRRAVPGLEKNAHGWDLIRLAQQKMAGQAAANTTVSERFAATLHDTEEIIGTALLPVLNQYLGSLSKWLQGMNQSGKLQKDAAQGAKVVAGAFRIAAKAVNLAADAIETYNKTKVDAKHVLGPLGFLVDNAEEAAKRLENTAKRSNKAWDAILHGHIFSYPTPAGTQLPGPRGPVGKPSDFLPPGLLGPSVTPADVQQAKRTAAQRNAFFDAMIGRDLDRVQDAPLRQQIARLQLIAGLIQLRILTTRDITRRLKLEDDLVNVFRQEKAVKAQLVQAMFDALQFNVDKAGLTASLVDDLAALRKMERVIEQQIKAAGRTLDLEQRLLSTQEQIQQVLAQQAANRDAARKARQFGALGLGPTGDDRIAGVKALGHELRSVQDAVAGTFLDTKKNRSLFAHIREVLSGQLGAVGRDVRQKIKEILDGIQQDLKNRQGDVTGFRHVSADALARSLGLNLTPQQLKRLEYGLSAVGPNLTVPGQRSLAFAGSGAVYTGDIHVHGVQNPRDFENQMDKRHKARPHTRRGAR